MTKRTYTEAFLPHDEDLPDFYLSPILINTDINIISTSNQNNNHIDEIPELEIIDLGITIREPKSSLPLPDSATIDYLNQKHDSLNKSMENCGSISSNATPPINKKQISLERIETHLNQGLRIKLSNKLSIKFSTKEIVFNGRPKIKGTPKQLCHVIPLIFVKEMISTILKSSQKISNIAQNIVKLLSYAVSNIKGYALNLAKNTQLIEEKDKDLVFNLSDRKLNQNGEEVLLYSPSKKQKLFSRLENKAEAKSNFQKIYPQYIKASTKILLDKIKNDHNTSILTIQEIAKYILTLFCINKNSVFALEGNTQHFEIRYYKNTSDAFDGNENYEVITALELKSKRHHLIDKHVRIVECEGANIKKYNASLKLLKQILIEKNNQELIEKYNNKYNVKIKFANVLFDLQEYNSKIKPENFSQQAAKHIAKNLYLGFDFKALEETIVIPHPKNILLPKINFSPNNFSVFKSATGEKLISYIFEDGKSYRDQQLKKCRINKKFLRNSEDNFKILSQKLAELFLIGTVDLSLIESIDQQILKTIFDHLINLAIIDHQINENDQQNFKNSVVKKYESIIPHESDNLDDIIILDSVLNDDEFNQDDLPVLGD